MAGQFPILVAEDRDDDVLLIRKAFASAGIPNPLYVVKDGDETLAYLAGELRYTNRDEYPLPGLLLLDLKMPGKDGFEVLKWIRQQPTLKALRVVVLTSSTDMRDVNKAYQLGANSFLVKPLDFQDLVALTKTIEGYWMGISKAPEISRPPRRPEFTIESETTQPIESAPDLRPTGTNGGQPPTESLDQRASIVVSAPSPQRRGMQKTETILVAEDDPTDAFFLERAFNKLGVPIALQFVRDGQEVIEYLCGEGQFANCPVHPSPDLLVLDLKMPRMDGFQVLNWLRQHSRLKLLPVIIFSSSAQNTDINRAYDLGANSYLVKPHATEDLLVVVEKLKNYWIESNKKPDDLAE